MNPARISFTILPSAFPFTSGIRDFMIFPLSFAVGASIPSSARTFSIVSLIWSSVTVNTLLAIIGSLQSFELIMTITRGQFNTSTLGMMVFATAFGGGGATASGGTVAGMRQGYAAAESMVLFVGVLIVTVISQAIMKKMEADQ